MSYLLYAVREHSYGITKFLLENEADPNTVSSLTSTPRCNRASSSFRNSML